MTPPLQFSQASTVCSTIPMHKSVFSIVLDDSSVRTKDILKDPIDMSEDTKIRIFALPPFLRYFITVTAAMMPNTPVVIGCDNIGVISHATCPPGPHSNEQPQADVVHVLHTILAKAHIQFQYTYVYGHQDDNTLLQGFHYSTSSMF